MWYLKIDTLCIMLTVALLFAAGQAATARLRPAVRLMPWLVVADLAVIAYVSKRLALFYAVYTLFTYATVELLRRTERSRRLLFVAFCILAVVPFFYVRFAAMDARLPILITLIGFSYNMLKAVDALFFVYYTKRKITFLSYANFILFFPVITGGPIFRYRDFLKYYEKPVAPTVESCKMCLKRFILGMFKKTVVVVWLGMVLNHLLAMGNHWYVSLALIYLSYLILYMDLSGYSDIAIAVGTFMGVPVPENFKKPLEAASFTQFWRKWHVTLSDWIREHIFVLVNGKRLDRRVGAMIGMGTMLVMSLWHEFSLLSVIDGIYMGAFLAIENLFSLTTVDRRKTKKWVYLLRCFLVTTFFGLNAMIYTLTDEQLGQVLGGFLSL